MASNEANYFSEKATITQIFFFESFRTDPAMITFGEQSQKLLRKMAFSHFLKRV